MPNYEYQCTACPNLFEIWQPVGEAAPPCPECGKEVKKVFHPPRVIFKGSGFYVTDLRAENSAKASAKSGAGKAPVAGDSASGSSASSSEKSADKSETSTDNSTSSAPATPSSTESTTTPASSPVKPASASNDSSRS